MTQYDNTNTGMLYKNDRRERDTHPEFTGFVNVDGVEYWLSAWVKEGKAGSKLEGKRYFSLSLRPKEQRAPASTGGGPAPSASPTRQSAQAGFEDDDIPFN